MNKDNVIKMLVLVAAILLYALGWCSHMAFVKPETMVKIETRRDTIRVDKPVPYEVTRWKFETLAVHDTTYLEDGTEKVDTLYVDIPMEKKSYKGDDYMLTISGYKPNLEFISVFPKTTTVTTTVPQVSKARKVALGMAVGPTVCYNGKWNTGIGGTFGVNISF